MTADTRTQPMEGQPRALGLVLPALFLSGTAGLINQVVWQRALKLFLGGSETLSSMTVVLVFLLGLGVGSLALGARAHRLVNPLRGLGWTELALGCVNIGVAVILSLEIQETVYGVQRVALSVGVPLRLLYLLGALVLLLPPCFLMGITMPLVSEACQRQLGYRKPSLLSVLFFLNTVGAVAGSLGSGFLMLPFLGQRRSLALAAACNLIVGVAMLWLSGRVRASQAADDGAERGPVRVLPTREDLLGGLLGFLALGYEMYLFRLMALAHQPLPFTFAKTLSLYLLCWSVGVYLSSTRRERLVPALVAGALLVALTPVMFIDDRYHLMVYPALLPTLVYFAPCVVFGVSYGWLVSGNAKRWGNDVGRFSAVNTIGSCLGIVFFTLVGYEVHQTSVARLIALGLVGTAGLIWSGRARIPARLAGTAAFAAAAVVLVQGLREPYRVTDNEGKNGAIVTTFHGRDGVIEVDQSGNLAWDGLWHSKFSNNKGDIKTRNWLLAVAPIVVHGEKPIRDALVVGLGVGITANTLAQIEGIERVDAYDINRTLERILEHYPEGTAHVGTNPLIHIIWQDARSGLALNERKYDLITQQPLHVKQAGSSILLSKEYFELVRSRLKPGGVFTIYSNTQAPGAAMVRATAAEVFRYTRTFMKGYLIVASQEPLRTDEAWFNQVKASGTAIGEQVRILDVTRGEDGLPPVSLYDLLDKDPLPVITSGQRVTDDFPLVEYEDFVKYVVRLDHPPPSLAGGEGH